MSIEIQLELPFTNHITKCNDEIIELMRVTCEEFYSEDEYITTANKTLVCNWEDALDGRFF
jgi:hypothetical protein